MRTLQRNVSKQYYYRLLQSQKKELVEAEKLHLPAPEELRAKIEAQKTYVFLSAEYYEFYLIVTGNQNA